MYGTRDGRHNHNAYIDFGCVWKRDHCWWQVQFLADAAQNDDYFPILSAIVIINQSTWTYCCILARNLKTMMVHLVTHDPRFASSLETVMVYTFTHELRITQQIFCCSPSSLVPGSDDQIQPLQVLSSSHDGKLDQMAELPGQISQNMEDAIVACLNIHDRLKEDFLQGYCLFQLAAYRAVGQIATVADETQAANLAGKLIDRVKDFVAEVRSHVRLYNHEWSLQWWA